MSVLDPPPFDPLDVPGLARVADVGLADDQVLVDAVRAMEAAQRQLDAARLAVLGELDARGEPITRTGLPTAAWLGSEFGLPRPSTMRRCSLASAPLGSSTSSWTCRSASSSWPRTSASSSGPGRCER